MKARSERLLFGCSIVAQAVGASRLQVGLSGLFRRSWNTAAMCVTTVVKIARKFPGLAESCRIHERAIGIFGILYLSLRGDS